MLLERAAPLRALRPVVDEVRSGRGTAAMVTGAAGIGKTQLLASFAAEARAAGVTCLRASGRVLERDYAFGVVRQLLTGLPEEIRDAVSSAAGGAAQAILDPSASIGPAAPDTVFATLNALFWGLSGGAEAQPLVLVVDDVQWVDDASARFLDFVMHRLDMAPFGLVTAFRNGEELTSAPVRELVVGEGFTRIELSPLSDDAVDQLIRHRLGDGVDGRFVEVCATWTAGNPLYLGELLATVISEGIPATAAGAAAISRIAPGAIGRVVLTRLGRAGAAAMSLAQSVAVLGDGCGLAVAAAHAGLDGPAAAVAADRLLRLGVLTDELAFVHPIVRGVVYEDMTGPLREQRHRAAAELLHEAGAPADAIAAQLALTSDAPPWAAGVLRAAAASALAQGAPDTAVRHLTHALATNPADRGALLTELGIAEAVTLAPDAVDHLAEAASLLPIGSERVDLEVGRSTLLLMAGRSRDAFQIAEVAYQEATAVDPDLGLPLLLRSMLARNVTPGLGGIDRQDVDRIRALPGETTTEREAHILAMLLMIGYGEPIAEIEDVLDRMMRNGGAPTTLSPVSWLHLLQNLGQTGRALELVEPYLEEADRLGSALWRCESLAVRAKAYYRVGRLADAEADARAAMLGGRQLFAMGQPLATANLIYTLLERGDVAGAIAVAEDFAFPDDREDTAIAAVVEAAIGRAKVKARDTAAGLATLLAAGAKLDSVGWLTTELSPWRVDATAALLALGRREEAAEVLAPAARVAERFGCPVGLGRVLQARAALENPVSIDLLRAAVAVYEPTDLRLKHARALIQLGAALRRAGHRADAREPLAEGVEHAHRCGADALVEHARTELAAAGARPRSIARTGVDALTPSERRVAQMAANGLNNREIARALYVEPSTVEKHLTATFRKLGISTRSELPVLG